MNEEIKKKILSHFVTKVKVADFLCVSKQQVNHWFNNGKYPNMQHSIKLADEIGVDWSDIRDDLRKV